MDNAKAAVRHTLNQAKTFLAQESPPRLSEADTKANFIEPIIAALGWTGIGVVTREYYVKNSQEFIDYVMTGSTGPLLAIESKALQADLTDKAAAQLIQYCSVEGIEWAALTNGRELQFFNTFLKPDLAAKRVLSLDLLAFNNDDEYDALFQQVWQLSRESMTTPTGVRSWLNQRRLDTALRGILLNPASPTLRQLRKVLSEADVSATPQDLVQWFRSHLGTPVTALPHPSQRHAAQREPDRPRHRLDIGPRAELLVETVDQGFDPRKSEVFDERHQHLLPLFAALRASVDARVSQASWRALKNYIAAEADGQTFLAVKRRGQGLVLGLALPKTAEGPRLTTNVGEFNWSRITKVVRVSDTSEVDEPLIDLIERAASYAPAAQRSSKFYGVTIRDLLDAKLLNPNERIILVKGKRDMATATVLANGEIVWQDRHYQTPSDRDFAALLGRQSLNGWTSWYVDRPEGRETLADIRARLQSRTADASA